MSSTGEVATASEATPVPWQVPGPDVSTAAFMDNCDHVARVFQEQVLDAHGGPLQYLQAKLREKEEQQSFCCWLWSAFPLQLDQVYHLENPLPSVDPAHIGDATVCKAHIAMFAYNKSCTMKPPPSGHSAKLLLQHLLMDGAVTGGEPLQVKHVEPDCQIQPPWKNESNGWPIDPFSLGFVKGALRASTLLSLLHMFWQDGQGLKLLETFNKLQASVVSGIFVVHVRHVSLQEEVFHNFKLSLRGSIRRPPNLLTWVGALSQLKLKGYEDSAGVIARFNSTVGSSFQLAGAKAAAVGNLMSHFPPLLLDLLQAHVSKFGWDSCVLSDDSLSSKKILPLFVHKSPHKAWKKFCAMSTSATTLTFRRLIRDFEKAPPFGRRKADKSTIESLAEMAALVVNLTKQLAELFPLKQADLDQEILDKWVEASPGLDLELHEASTEKKESLAVTDIKAFRAVADMLHCKIPVPKTAEDIQLADLDEGKFQLLKKQLDYDRAVFRAYQLKMQSHESAVHHAKIEWKQKLQQEAAHWSTSWLSKKCKIFSYDASQTGALQKLANDNMQALIRSAGLERSSVVACRILVIQFGFSTLVNLNKL